MVDELGQSVGEPGVRIYAVELRGLDQRGEDGPVVAALVTAGEQGVLAIECDGPDRSLNRVGVDLDAAVVEESAAAFWSAVPPGACQHHGHGSLPPSRTARRCEPAPHCKREVTDWHRKHALRVLRANPSMACDAPCVTSARSRQSESPHGPKMEQGITARNRTWPATPHA